MPTDNLAAAERFIERALALVGSANEQAIRDNLTSYLRQMFPDPEWWVDEHVNLCESKLRYSVAAKAKLGFVDNLVGCTAIEYEADLNKTLAAGKEQVRDYCAGLLQDGVAQDLVYGVLSDTLRWRAYRVKSCTWGKDAAGRSVVDSSSVVLEEIEPVLELHASSQAEAERLVRFLRKYLGRQGARRLAAETLSTDLGLQSKFYLRHVADLQATIRGQLAARPEYARVLGDLWERFVGFVSPAKDPVKFDPDSYAAECYILTLAKLAVANVLSRHALNSDEDELRDILSGEFFRSRGIDNLVEYDYFGWLNEAPTVDALLAIARGMQQDIAAYDFASNPAEDLFGRLLTQLASRVQRILLGQAWTPPWLARKVVRWAMSHLPGNQAPQLLDMCCGSGTLLVEALKERGSTLPGTWAPAERYLALRATITGFDIDPLAVMLAKASWLLTALDLLQPDALSDAISIPVYNADSLMRITGLASEGIDDQLRKGAAVLAFADRTVNLPAFLVTPGRQRQFDLLLDHAYQYARNLAEAELSHDAAGVSAQLAEAGLTQAEGLTKDEAAQARRFVDDFVGAVTRLQMERRNGIWAFVLKNSYRPALVAGQFNGLVSNPPWLTMSKIRANPYGVFLRAKAKEFAVNPVGAAWVHTELATVFLLHAVERFLCEGAAYACIVPDAVLNGAHQQRFRQSKFLDAASRPVAMTFEEVWQVDSEAFTGNLAVVLCGHRDKTAAEAGVALPGKEVGPLTEANVAYRVHKAGGKLVWSKHASAFAPRGGADSRFAQGADIFPRRIWFHALSATAHDYTVRRAEAGDPEHYLVADEKKKACQSFRVPPTPIRKSRFQPVLLSKHLASFHLAPAAWALLPFEQSASGAWTALPPGKLAADTRLYKVMKPCLKGFREAQGRPATAQAVLDYVDTQRGKLSAQRFTEPYLVVYGTSGSALCAALLRDPRTAYPKLIVDQTLYAASFASEDEAFYYLGMLNSPDVDAAIKPFQPQGKQTERHIHKLPLLFIPRFEAANLRHTKVARATKVLQQEFLAGSAAIAPQLDPNRNLGSRRTAVRDYVRELPGYPAFVAACHAVLA